MGATTPHPRSSPAKLEDALEAAQKRVLAADKAVAAAGSDSDFMAATDVLEASVTNLEKIASCVQRCAIVAQTLAYPVISSTLYCRGRRDDAERERDPKRSKIDAGASLAPTALAFGDSSGAGGHPVHAGEKDGVDCE